MTQQHPYDENLSYHLVNLALVGGVQPAWEADDSRNPDVDNLFAVPHQYYGDLFLTCNTPSDALYDDIQGYIRNHYELIGAIRLGQEVVPDYEGPDPNRVTPQSYSIEFLIRMMTGYSQRVTESFSNSIRYGFSRLLMGYALRAKGGGHGIIVLRGTVTVNEWLNNINYRLVPFHVLDSQYGNVHNGFRDIYKGIRGRYRELVNQFDVETPLYLVGHSLGGAVSQLAALDIAIQSPERASHLQVYDYGAPRVGDSLFAEVYNHLVGTSYRIVNVCDVVPYIPFEEIGIPINQPAYPYADTKGEIGFVHQAGDPVTNHISSYHIATRMKVPAPMDASIPRRLL